MEGDPRDKKIIGFGTRQQRFIKIHSKEDADNSKRMGAISCDNNKKVKVIKNKNKNNNNNTNKNNIEIKIKI